jgi:methylmalonyl-CoA/ethylmalonyl-CoA epimerase
VESLADALGLGAPYHIGIAVRDLTDAMPRFKELLGIGPWGRIDAEVPAIFRGTETVSGVRSAFARLGSMYVELVEPTVGGFPAKTFLEERGEGIYHLGYWVEDMPAAIRSAAERGLRVEWSFPAKEPLVAYLDAAETFGFHLEFVSPSLRAGIEDAIDKAAQ